MIKKFFALFLGAGLAVSIIGCASTSEAATAAKKEEEPVVVENPFVPGDFWEATEYVKSYSSDGAKLGDETKLGKITGGANLKMVNKGAGVAGTIAENTTGYVQVSNGKAGSISFGVTPEVKKLTIAAKAVSGKAFQVKQNGNVIRKAIDCCKSDYENHVIELNNSADALIEISGYGATCNVKAIKAE